ncbi:MAG TPA: glucans biosynthesis glucosyltransferase MdoH [Pirellulales bacterium]
MSCARRASRAGPRALLAALTMLTTAGGTWIFWQSLPAASPAWLSLALLLVFVVLFVQLAFSFWMATAGFVCALRTRHAPPEERAIARFEAMSPGTTAIVMPVYNESPHRVFAGLRAVHESLQATGHGQRFDFFVLSDTTNPDLWLAEELAWAQLNQALGAGSRVYYRHRPKNAGRKAGNIADFCERWGWAYRYMIVLDADSVMSGETLVEMVRRMDDDPQTGILQVPPVPVNQVSLFARCQQFAASVYGPVFLQGFAWWSHVDGNYWGHNAIIRIEPFLNHCGLSHLPGIEPLGGEILSHDFVEAALMRRAGWQVRLAHDLGGSYEECPPSLIDFAQRDQRWCQGNMQHIRLVFSSGLHPVSRLHFGLGAMSYLSSPLWLLFLVLSFLLVGVNGAAERGAAADWRPLGLFAATMLMLLLPKLWGFILLTCDSQRLAQCGGATHVAAGIVIETAVSMLVSPIMMAFHSHFVVSTFLGRRIEWTAQRRGQQGQPWLAALAAHWKQTLAGLAAALVIWAVAPAMLLWLSPVLVGLVLAIPLSLLLSSVPIGRAAAGKHLLSTPEETAVPQVLRRHRHLLSLPPMRELADLGGIFRRILADPAFVALHRSVLMATDATSPADARQLQLAERQLIAGGPARVSIENRKAILSDPEALHALHLFAWTRTRKEAS